MHFTFKQISKCYWKSNSKREQFWFPKNLVMIDLKHDFKINQI